MHRFASAALYTALLFGTFVLHESPLLAQTRLPTLHWPLGKTLDGGVFIHMHVDNDPSSGVDADYRCSNLFTYDGHRGTDLSLYNFRLMDEGVPVLAAADGVVSWVRDGEFDRNYWPPYRGQPNGIVIQHADGSNSQYWHLRQNSVAVTVGERVDAGQMLAYVGSSGATPIPHVHFELWEQGPTGLQVRDPFEGPCSASSVLWPQPYPYPGDTALRILDAGIFDKTNLQGNEANNYFGEKTLKDRPAHPEVWGLDEPTLGVWTQLQALPNAQYTVSVLKPDGTVWNEQRKTMALTQAGVQWHVFYWPFAAHVTANDAGTWVVHIESDGERIKSIPFEVGTTSVYGPRFLLAGRSFKVSEMEQRHFQFMSPQSEEVTLHLVDAPAYVQLDENQLVVQANASPTYRNTFFQVVATDGAGRTDTAYYHIVDLAQPQHPTATSREMPNHSSLSLTAYPNPFSRQVHLTYSLEHPAFVELTVYTLLGQRIATLVQQDHVAGTHMIRWDNTPYATGTYLVQLRVGSERLTQPLIYQR